MAGIAGVAVSLAGSLLTVTAGQADAVTAIANGNFETNVGGWTVTKNSSIVRHAPGYTGRYAARVTNQGTQKTTVLNDRTNSVGSTAKGRTYDVTAYVRTWQPGISVGLRGMEFAGSTLKGEKQDPVRLTDTKWHRLSFAYTAQSTGAQLDINVLGWALPRGRSYDVDNVSVTARTATTSGTVLAPADPAPTTPAPTAPTTTTPTTTKPVAPAGWKLAWADEFNGSTLDRTKWNAENNSTYGDGNKELACLMDRPENLAMGGGALTIKARKEATPIKCGTKDARFPNGRDYTSAMLTTRGKADFNYGRFEVRAKLPTQAGTSKGLWPAFWMRPTNGGTGELDILEAIGSNGTAEANKVHQTIWYDYVKTHPAQPYTATLPGGALGSDGFHTYAAEWEPGVIRWYVDGKLTCTRDRSTTSWIDEAFAPGKRFYIRLNMAVGGSWPGTPDLDTKFPADYVVDYVRTYTR